VHKHPALTGEQDDATVALGYASASAPDAAGFATASLPPARPAAAMQTAAAMPDAARMPVEPASRYAPQAASPTAAAVARSAAQTAKGDRIADPTAKLVAGKSDRASEGRLYDVSGSTAGRGFAQLRHPDQESLAGLLAKPGVALATGFGYGAYEDLAPQRFTGPAIVALAVVRTQ
jgi:hypothetical protein